MSIIIRLIVLLVVTILMRVLIYIKDKNEDFETSSIRLLYSITYNFMVAIWVLLALVSAISYLLQD